ncbi:MAG: hypothetical protein WC211_10015 [Dehalococcoidia bacterium]
MPSGLANQLTKQRGEYAVAAELARRGLLVAPFSGNVPDFDLVAVREDGSTVLVQGKAMTNSSWQFNVDDFLVVEDDANREIQIVHGLKPLKAEIIWVMLRLTADQQPEYWIARQADIQGIVHAGYVDYLAKCAVPGHRPKQWRSHHTAIRPVELATHLDDWGLITNGRA